MSGPTTGTTTELHLHDWPPRPAHVTRAGSLYSLPATERLAAAELLHRAGWWIHVDVITRETTHDVDPDAGVPRRVLAQVRELLPAARVELHLMDAGGTDLGALLTEVLRARPERVVLPGDRCGPDDPATRAVRSTGAQLWAELAPGDREEPQPGTDGTLLMLIRPGTRGAADLDRLRLVPHLARHGPVGVDGGVGRAELSACVAAGVGHVVSGRALLTPAVFVPERRSSP